MTMKKVLNNWKIEVDKINVCPQRQDSATEKLADLVHVANKLGFYDAADLMFKILSNGKRI